MVLSPISIVPIPAPDYSHFSRAATRRLTSLAEGTGYVSEVTRLAIDEVSRRKSSEPLTRLLGFLETGGTVRDYEGIVAGLIGQAPRAWWTRYVPKRFQRSDARKRFGSNPHLEQIIRVAADSPLADLRMERLSRLLAKPEPLLGLKLAELADTKLRLSASKPLPLRAPQRDAYLGDIGAQAMLFELESLSEDLTEPSAAAESSVRRRWILRKSFEGRFIRSLAPRDIVRSFRLLRDDHSLRVAAAIESGGLKLFLFADDFNDRVTELYERAGIKTPRLGTEEALYFHSGLVGPSALLAVRVPPLASAPDAEVSDVLFEILATIVHEFQHHEDASPSERKTAPVVFRLELRAHAREFLWRAEWGDTEWLEAFTLHAPLGFALKFRDHFERYYGATSAFRSRY